MKLLCRIFWHDYRTTVKTSFGVYAFRCGRCGEQTFGKGKR